MLLLDYSKLHEDSMHFQNNNIKRTTERNTIIRYVAFYPGKPSWGRKPQKKSSIIDSQYNAKTKTKTPKINQYRACTYLLLPPATTTVLKICTLDE